MLELALFIVAGLYGAEYLFFRAGIARALRRGRARDRSNPQPDGDDRPFVSVVVAARNEEQSIEECVWSILDQSWPDDRYEVVVVDDESTDRTHAILTGMTSAQNRLRVVRTTPDESGLVGKPRAIAQGVDASRGSIVMMTDADCVVPQTWIEATVSHFDQGADVVAGFTVVDGRTFFGRLQQLDWLHLQSIASASLAFNSPVGVVGNNLAFRREQYEKIGGYRSVPFSITEDFTLALALWREGAEVSYPCDRGMRVVTRPCADLPAVLRQKHRWGRGGMESTPHGYSILVVAFLMLCALLAAPFVSPLAWGVAWGTKFLADVLLLAPVARRLGVLSGLSAFIPFQFYFLAQALIVPIMVANPNVVWKGRVFQTVRPGVAKK